MKSDAALYSPPHPSKLLNEALPAPWGSEGHYLNLSDNAVIWYSQTGSGRPLVLVHGWRASSRFWKRNVPELARHFRVVVLDLRGHGSSTKVLHGHTISRYAQDLHELCGYLELERPVFAGWSMAGSICMDYWWRFGPDHMSGLVLVDSNVAPFANGSWNAFRMKEGKSDAHNDNIRALAKDPEAFSREFAIGMFGSKPGTEEEIAWMTDEQTKTPPWIAAAVHSDFVVRDYEQLIPSVTVPAAVFSGNWGPSNLEMGKHFADYFQDGRYYPFENCGHLLFYEDAPRFNREMIAFGQSLR